MQECQWLDIIQAAYEDDDFYSLLMGDKRYNRRDEEGHYDMATYLLFDGWETFTLEKVNYAKLFNKMKSFIWLNEQNRQDILDKIKPSITKALKQEDFVINCYGLLALFALIEAKGNDEYCLWDEVIKDVDKQIGGSFVLPYYDKEDKDLNDLYDKVLMSDISQHRYTKKYFLEENGRKYGRN